MMIIPTMAGYPSNLAKKFSPTEQFPQHIFPLLPLYNAQWLVYESLTAIALVLLEKYIVISYNLCKTLYKLITFIRTGI